MVPDSELNMPPGVMAWSGNDSVYWTNMIAYGNGDGAGSTHTAYVAAVSYLSSLATNRNLYPYCSPPNSTDPIPLSDAGWNQATSLWYNAQACVWPIDTSDQAYCDMGTSGTHP